MRRNVTIAVVVCALLTGCQSYQAAKPGVRRVSDAVLKTEDRFSIKLTPEHLQPDAAGVIFYPGGLVSPEAYVTLFSRIAEAGHPVTIVKMPLDLAVYAPNRAGRFLDSIPESDSRPYALAGHSLGGAMAARFVSRNPSKYPQLSGLILLAAYPPEADPLVDAPFPVLSVYAEHDGLVSEEERRTARENLPRDATIVEIEGGNHAGFGDYGPQEDDGERTVSLEQQHEQVSQLIISFLRSF